MIDLDRPNQQDDEMQYSQVSQNISGRILWSMFDIWDATDGIEDEYGNELMGNVAMMRSIGYKMHKLIFNY